MRQFVDYVSASKASKKEIRMLWTEGKTLAIGTRLIIRDYENPVRFMVYNVRGEVVRAGSLSSKENKTFDLMPGVYIVQLKDRVRGEVTHKKVLIMR